MMQKYVRKKLTKYIPKYFAAHPDVRLVLIAGSIDKASTKDAVGTVLAQRYRVRVHEHYARSPLAVPLAVLGIEMPKKWGLFTWWSILRAAKYRIKHQPDIDVIVQELTVSRPGETAEMMAFLKPHITIVTGVTLEHVEVYGSIEAVAQEHLTAANVAQFAIIGRDNIEGRFSSYLDQHANLTTYGTSNVAEYWIEHADEYSLQGTKIQLSAPELPQPLAGITHTVGEQSLRPLAAALATGLQMGVSSEQIVMGLSLVQAIPGRLRPLRGINGTIILDDTYRANPLNAAAALQTLYEFDQAPQRIAVFSSFHNLGQWSEEEHHKIGLLCNPDLLAWVVVVGVDAEKYLAPAARQRGCQVQVCRDAIEAGKFVRSVTVEGAVILVEGAGPETYLEEAVKILCEMTEDHHLVRQSPHWQAIKDEHFSRFADKKKK